MAFGIFKKKKDKDTDTPVDATLNDENEKEASPDAEAPEPVMDASDEPVESDPEDIPADDPQEKTGGFFHKLKKGLSRTRDILTTDVDELFTGNRKVDDDLLEELEELLITSDMGVQLTMELIDMIRKKVSRIKSADDLKNALKEEIIALMADNDPQPAVMTVKPFVTMIVGVNGVGKTTTIGKLANLLRTQGKKVLISAADTFRAAAVEQLAIWAERTQSDFVRHRDNADPGAVAYDSVEAAMARGMDVVLIDTAGRLHTKVNLMAELKKISRVISKKISTAPHEVLLVLDATTGQNAISQAKLFHEAIGVTGIVLTKLDGTAKGGIVINIANTLNIPIRYIGVGEGIDDLQPFDADEFVNALF